MPAHLGIDFGTSHTVAVLRRSDGRVEALTFDGSPLLPSAVHAGTVVNVGVDALHAARSNPAAVEPHPKRRVDDGTVLLGEREFSVAELFAAVLKRVRDRCAEVAREVPAAVTITHPAAWGPARRAVLREAASLAGMPDARLLPEPVAAAMYYTRELGVDVPDGSAVAVHDFGGGTFDASVVRRAGDGFEVLAVDGLADLGGVDLDEAIIRHLRENVGTPETWARLMKGEDVATRRALAGFRVDVRATKERLSRQTVAELFIPVVDVEAHLTREELESVVAPMLERAVKVTHAVLAEAAVPPERRAGVFLVGGGSRMPLVATLLHRVLGAVPTLTDDVEQVVARGAILSDADRTLIPAQAGIGVPAQPGIPVGATAPVPLHAATSPGMPAAPTPGHPPPTTPPIGPGRPLASGFDRPLALRASIPILLGQLACAAIGLLITGQYLDETDEAPDIIGFATMIVAVGVFITGLSMRKEVARVLAISGQIALTIAFTYGFNIAPEWNRNGTDTREVMAAVPFAVALIPAVINIALLTTSAVATWYRDGVRGQPARRWPYWAGLAAAVLVSAILITVRYES